MSRIVVLLANFAIFWSAILDRQDLKIDGIVEEKTFAGTYVVLAPRFIRPGLPYALSFKLSEEVTSSNIVRVEIRNGHNETIEERVQSNVTPGQPIAVRIDRVDPLKLVAGGQYKVFVEAEDSGGNTLFRNEKPIEYNGKALSIFVQTDQPIYKPGSTVHYRVVVANPDLTPHRGLISFKISDPYQNAIKQMTNISLSKGVMSGDLELSKEPPIGDWKIQVQSGDGYTFEKTFRVRKYVLPSKFEVKVNPPSIVTVNDDIPVIVKAKYSYAKNVRGTVSLIAAEPSTYNKFRWARENEYPRIIKTDTLNDDGEVTIRFTNKELKEYHLVDHGYEDLIKFIATVTETRTGIERNGTAEIKVHSLATIVKITTLEDTFKPGLNYSVLVSVVLRDDSALPTRSYSKQVLLKTQYYYPHKLCEGKAGPKETRRISLDADGSKTMTVSPPLEAEYMRIEVIYIKTGVSNDTKDYSYALKGVKASKSPSNTFIQLSPMQGPVAAGDMAKFKVRATSTTVSVVTMQVMARGYILDSRNIHFVNQQAEILVKTSYEMAPKSRLIVYGVMPDNKEIVVDAIDFKVEGLIRNEVSLSLSKDSAEPGQDLEVTVRADAGSYVGLLAVDASVLQMKSENDITADIKRAAGWMIIKFQVEDDVKEYDTAWFGGVLRSSIYNPYRDGTRRKRSFRYPYFCGIGYEQDAKTIFQVCVYLLKNKILNLLTAHSTMAGVLLESGRRDYTQIR